MAWEWSVQGDNITHVWAATYNGSADFENHRFDTTPALNYYHRWIEDPCLPTLLVRKTWQVCGPPNGDGVELPSCWEMPFY